MSDYFDSDNEELLKDFYAEAEQQVETLEQNILAMENDPGDKDAIDEIFRAAHTLKGGAATVQMNELAEFTHAMEDLLDEIRSGGLTPDGDIIDALLQGLDVIKAMLEARQNGEVYSQDAVSLKSKLRSYIKKEGKEKKKKAAAPPPPKAAAPSQPATAPAAAGENSMSSGPSVSMTDYDLQEMKATAGPNGETYRVRVDFDPDNPMNTVGGIQVFAVLKSLGQVLRTFPDFDSLYEDEFYPTVDYYLLSKEKPEEIEKKSVLADVTLKIAVTPLASLENDEPESKTPPDSGQTDESPAAQAAESPSETSQARQADNAAAAQAAALATAPKKTHAAKKETVSQILRVDSRRIDTLLNLVSEIVITKGSLNQVSALFAETVNALAAARSGFSNNVKELLEAMPELLELAMRSSAGANEIRKEIARRASLVNNDWDTFEGKFKGSVNKFRSVTADLARTTGELYEGVLKIRMVPVDQVFQRFPRLVRDLTKSLSKDVKLEIVGGETEMDKTVAEELFDPLMHCVRNSMDHGIETPAERQKNGKPSEGRLTLKASNQGNMVVIEIDDDGRGIDVEAIRAKAVERGLIHSGKAVSDQEAYNLMMEPGFSTAKTITNLSGRGVGLDVVKKSIEKLNGDISIWSQWGEGTTFTIKLPLTLAIIQGLMVRVGQGIYVVPITSVLESFRIRPEEVRMLDNYEVFNVREDVVSILRLSKLFKVESRKDNDYEFIVVVGSEDKKIGLMVDALIGEEEVVIKPLKDQYTNSPGIAGATILGDGAVGLIIDVSQLLGLGLKQERAARQERNATALSAAAAE